MDNGVRAMDDFITLDKTKQAVPKPPISRRRIAGEILAGAVVGLAVALPLGYVLHRIGKRNDEIASFSSTFGWGIIGVFVMMVVSIILPIVRAEKVTVLFILLLVPVLLIPTIFATYGFDRNRRHKESPSS